MAFFDELSKKITQASQDVAKKTKDITDTAVYNSKISDEEKKIQGLYTQIGQSYYELHKNDPEDALAALVAEVNQANANIQSYRDQISLIKGTQKCPNCGTEVAGEALFCNACGTRMPPKAAAEQPAAPGATCPSCGNAVPENQKFCIHCGASLAAAPAPAPAVKVCGTCGKELSPDAAFCTGCGSMV